MDRTTVEVYEREAQRWVAERGRPRFADDAAALAGRCEPGEWRADLGCGPGWHGPHLGRGGPVVSIDAARSMVGRIREHAPDAFGVVADLEALPLRAGALGGAWASKSYQHVPMARLPLALADLHRSLHVGAPAVIRVTSDRRIDERWNDEFGDRHFSYWPTDRLRAVLIGAGFSVDAIVDDGRDWLTASVRRELTLADVVGPALRMLIVGLNPSVYAAERGVGFARPGNRFWPALLASGLAERDREPLHAYRNFGIGFTDLVKRATARADELAPEEYVEGAERVRAFVEWLTPGAVCFAGLSGYRIAVDRHARAGWQAEPFGGRPAYVMPNPSGLNAHTNIADLAAHLRRAATPPRSTA